MSYDFFELDEFKCPCCNENEISKHLVSLLDRIRREYILFPIKINSGYRCAAHNEEVGGSKTSSHLDGVAVDIHCVNSARRFFLLETLPKFFTRIGVAKTFVHVDIDHKKPDSLCWVY
jgi:uncharacterized protein YcbK (DUF882 family)